MKDLHTLHDTAQEMLGGLTAGEALRRRVLTQAERPEQAQSKKKNAFWTYAPACAAVALVLGISVLTVGKLGLQAGESEDTVNVFSAGQATMIPGILVADVPADSLVVTGEDGQPSEGDMTEMNPTYEVPPEVEQALGGEPEADLTYTDQGQEDAEYLPDQEMDVNWQDDYTSVEDWDTTQELEVEEQPVEQANLPAYHNLFVQWDGANIPLVGMYGRAYQQLHVGVSQDMLSDPLGAIARYTDEPSLESTEAWNSFLSNAVPEGTTVYMVQGISADTAIAVELNGAYTLFQRVSFAGHGTGGQSLEEVMGVRGNVASLTLSGVGVLSESGKANAMMSLLLDNASFYADNSFQGNQSLDITLTNGLTLQMQISDGVFTSCGAWTCTEFFDQYQRMLAQ